MAIFGGRKLIPMDEEGKQQPEQAVPGIEKGDLVKDKITGFTGVAICVMDYLHGCTRIAVQSQELKDGVPKDHQYFDSIQLEILDKGFYFKEPVPVKVKPTGGDQYIHDPGPEYAINRTR